MNEGMRNVWRGEVQVELNDGRIWEGMSKKFWCIALGINAKKMLYQRVMVLSSLYGDETWINREKIDRM